jgi:hypothetical protein
VVDALKFAEEAMMIGGVTGDHLAFNLEMIGDVDLLIPANIANACWNPRRRAKTTGIRSWSPKNGARCLDFFMKGRFGLNKKAEPISHYLKGKSLWELAIIVLANQSLFRGESLSEVGEVLSNSPLGWVFIGTSDLIWPIHGTFVDGDRHFGDV